jgi:GWxTD domain-containing protein
MIFILLSILPFNPAPEINLYQIPKGESVWFIVNFNIPHTYMIYEKRGEGYEADLELIVQVKGEKKILHDDFWRYTQQVDTYEETIDKKSFFSKHIVTKLPLQDSYRFKVKLKSPRSGSIIFEKEEEIKRYKEPVSDLIPLDIPSYKSGKKKPIPRYLIGDTLLLYYEILEPQSPVKVEWKLKKKEEDEVLLRDEKTVKDKNLISDVLLIPLDTLSGDDYYVDVKFTSSNFEAERRFFFSFYSMKRISKRDFDMLIDALQYIADPDEIKDLKNAPPQERERLWREFWDKRDPTPGTPTNEFEEEYLRRVDYANKHFSIGKWPGYRTDMGMIYIKFGPPDNIENYPYEVDQRPYQIWYYYAQNRVFIFVDRLGIGDYELVYPRNINYDF